MVPSTALGERALAPRSWKNQRATVRYYCAPATCGRLVLAGDKEYQRGWILNLSRGGMGLQLPRAAPLGAMAHVYMTGVVSRKNYEFTAHIVHATQHPNGEWIVGLEFLQQLTEEDLDDLLS